MKPERLDLLRQTAEKVDTGTESPETSRAFVVFNEGESALTGTAVFHADMPWRRNIPLPPIVVTEMDGRAVPSVVGDIARRDDARARPDREQIAFDIFFAVTDIPAQGWKTYLAWFIKPSGMGNIESTLSEITQEFFVIETTRHCGDLPASGTF